MVGPGLRLTARAQGRGIAAARSWSPSELLLAGTLLALAAVAWLLTVVLAMPGMESGVLTGLHPMEGMGNGTAPGAAVLFLATWMLMMAAMMLPAVTPFMVGMRRLLGARAGGGTLGALVAGYLLVWGLSGVLGYAVVQAFENLAMRGDAVVAVRAGAAVLVAAGVYQFTPLKHWCLVRCRSPLALVVRYAAPATRNRRGALRVGVVHGGYCLGCCWALMGVLLAAGVMSLIWMAAIAGVITLEKVLPRAETFALGIGVVLLGLGAVLLAAPHLVAAPM
ncbi:MAG TPA: DUF2182 domain-containing protein [Streptomyces sp.]|nr:DUF2182 domain-containing protein [Streptomyces sp.]